MKRVIEKLVEYLGLPADSSEEVVLAAMEDLPMAAAHAQLQMDIEALERKRDALVAAKKKKPPEDAKAMRIRSRAHEIVRDCGGPFSVAFRKAEKELERESSSRPKGAGTRKNTASTATAGM